MIVFVGLTQIEPTMCYVPSCVGCNNDRWVVWFGQVNEFDTTARVRASPTTFVYFSAVLGQFLEILCEFQIQLFWDQPIFTVQF